MDEYARVYMFPGYSVKVPSDIILAARAEDAANLRQRCRLQADVARAAAEAAAHLSADADMDGHQEATRRIQLAVLRFKQAQRELQLAEREITNDPKGGAA
jgi:hypothetical protein